MNALLICMQNELTAMASLVDVLGQEQAALTQAPSLELMEEINAITVTKNQWINSLNQLGKARKQALTRLGLGHVEQNLELYLQDHDQRDCWSKLMAKTKKAKELNRVNGLLITRHLLRNQSTLEVLYQHHQHTNMPTLYGANGQSNPQRSLIRGFGC